MLKTFTRGNYRAEGFKGGTTDEFWGHQAIRAPVRHRRFSRKVKRVSEWKICTMSMQVSPWRRLSAVKIAKHVRSSEVQMRAMPALSSPRRQRQPSVPAPHSGRPSNGPHRHQTRTHGQTRSRVRRLGTHSTYATEHRWCTVSAHQHTTERERTSHSPLRAYNRARDDLPRVCPQPAHHRQVDDHAPRQPHALR